MTLGIKMTENIYRHCTNLRVPFDRADTNLLSILGDYRIASPVPSNCKTAKTAEELCALGHVGLYVAEDELELPDIRDLLGCADSEKDSGLQWGGQPWGPTIGENENLSSNLKGAA